MPTIFKASNRSFVCLCVILSVFQITACSSSDETTDVKTLTQSNIEGQGNNLGNGLDPQQDFDQGYDQSSNQDNSPIYDQSVGQDYAQGNAQDDDLSYGQDSYLFQKAPTSALPPSEQILVIGGQILSWQPPVTREDNTPLLISEIAEYRIYYGTSRKDYQEMIEIKTGGINRYDFSVFPRGIYYMVLTAVDVDGRESLYSREMLLINIA